MKLEMSINIEIDAINGIFMLKSSKTVIYHANIKINVKMPKISSSAVLSIKKFSHDVAKMSTALPDPKRVMKWLRYVSLALYFVVCLPLRTSQYDLPLPEK